MFIIKELIKIDNSGKITARELYNFLELTAGSFARWAKTNIEENDFYQEGVDWEGVSIVLNGNETKDYSLTIDFAKHLCMLSRSERGKQARTYFVEVESRLKNANAPVCIEDVIIAQATALKQLRLQMESQQAELVHHGDRLKELAAKMETSPAEYYTIAGYASLRGIKVDVNKASLLGRMATKLSTEYAYHVGKIYDPRFGQVNTYHLDVLNEVFQM